MNKMWSRRENEELKNDSKVFSLSNWKLILTLRWERWWADQDWGQGWRGKRSTGLGSLHVLSGELGMGWRLKSWNHQHIGGIKNHECRWDHQRNEDRWAGQSKALSPGHCSARGGK